MEKTIDKDIISVIRDYGFISQLEEFKKNDTVTIFLIGISRFLIINILKLKFLKSQSFTS